MPTSTRPLTVADVIERLQSMNPSALVMMQKDGEFVAMFPKAIDEQGLVVFLPLA